MHQEKQCPAMAAAQLHHQQHPWDKGSGSKQTSYNSNDLDIANLFFFHMNILQQVKLHICNISFIILCMSHTAKTIKVSVSNDKGLTSHDPSLYVYAYDT